MDAQTCPLLEFLPSVRDTGPHQSAFRTVELISVESGVLEVGGLDAIDGTPVLDVKPYYPAFDRVEAPTVPDWIGPLMKDYF